MFGIIGLKTPRNQYYEFNVDMRDLGGLTYVNVINNFKYLELYFSVAAF